jgi:hypothetical protein
MALGSTRPLTEMSARNLPVGKERQVHKADKLKTICQPIVLKMWESQRLTTLWPPRPVKGVASPFYRLHNEDIKIYITI